MADQNKKVSIEGKYLISLLRATLRDELPAPVPSDLNWNRLLLLAQKHLVEATVYRAVKAQGSCPDEILSRWKILADNSLRLELLFDAERSEILKIFDQENINYLPLKGILIKDFYPHKGMRRFSDNDILFDSKKRKRVRKIMQERGYKVERYRKFSAHDVYMKKPIFNFEMHKSLFDAGFNVEYFNKIWTRAIKDEDQNCAFHMTNEDFYLYFIAHSQKHYEHGGIGLRFFVDLLYIRRKLNYDKEFVGKALTKMGMEAFEENMLGLAEAMFGDTPHEVSDDVMHFIFVSGAHGTFEQRLELEGKKKGKFATVLRVLFPPFKEMEIRFSFLHYLPFLLPMGWVLRWIVALFDKERLRKIYSAIKYSFKKQK